VKSFGHFVLRNISLDNIRKKKKKERKEKREEILLEMCVGSLDHLDST
jgi:hypothetical protein